jgi:hypothetical protein
MPKIPMTPNKKTTNVRYKMNKRGCIPVKIIIISLIYDTEENKNNKKHIREKMNAQKFNFLTNCMSSRRSTSTSPSMIC